MDKQSASKVAQVLRDAQSAIRLVTAERDKLAAENAAFKRREEASKVASALHSKGINTDVDFDDLVANLEKEAEAGHLPEIARAVDMIGPDMSFGRPNHDDVTGGSGDAFTGYIMGSVG